MDPFAADDSQIYKSPTCNLKKIHTTRARELKEFMRTWEVTQFHISVAPGIPVQANISASIPINISNIYSSSVPIL